MQNENEKTDCCTNSGIEKKRGNTVVTTEAFYMTFDCCPLSFFAFSFICLLIFFLTFSKLPVVFFHFWFFYLADTLTLITAFNKAKRQFVLYTFFCTRLDQFFHNKNNIFCSRFLSSTVCIEIWKNKCVWQCLAVLETV